MKTVQVNELAMETALTALLGADGAGQVRDLYRLLDNAHAEGYAKAVEDTQARKRKAFNNGYDIGYDCGYDDGFENALAQDVATATVEVVIFPVAPESLEGDAAALDIELRFNNPNGDWA